MIEQFSLRTREQGAGQFRPEQALQAFQEWHYMRALSGKAAGVALVLPYPASRPDWISNPATEAEIGARLPEQIVLPRQATALRSRR